MLDFTAGCFAFALRALGAAPVHEGCLPKADLRLGLLFAVRVGPGQIQSNSDSLALKMI